MVDLSVPIVVFGIESGEFKSGRILSFPVFAGKAFFPSSVGTSEGNSFINFCIVIISCMVGKEREREREEEKAILFVRSDIIWQHVVA